MPKISSWSRRNEDRDVTPEYIPRSTRSKIAKGATANGDSTVKKVAEELVQDAKLEAEVNGKPAGTPKKTSKRATAEKAGDKDETPAKKPRKSQVKVDDAEEEATPAPAKKARGKAKVKEEDGGEGAEAGPSKSRGKAKAWPPADLETSSHPPRAGHPIFALPQLTVPGNGAVPPTVSTPRPHLVGAHTSSAGGVGTALFRAGKAGANGLALFVKSQRQWKSNPFEQETIDRFREAMKPVEEGGLGYGPETILVHGSYLINLGNPDPVKWNTSYACFKDDIHRCHQLGVKLYNWHPGSTVGACEKEESLALIAKAINRVHSEIPEVITVIENMANAKSNLVGTAFTELATIIEQVKDKSRVRVCLDTCHLFAAGYDISTKEGYHAVLKQFDEEVGNGYLGGVHLNDSKADLGSCKDLHENIGLGKIGLTAFRELMRDPLMSGLPLILETPATVGNPLEVGELSLWQREIKMLYEIQEIDDEAWETKKVEIEARWRAERDKLSPPKEKKEKAKAGKKGKAKGKKANDEESCESHAEDSD